MVGHVGSSFEAVNAAGCFDLNGLVQSLHAAASNHLPPFFRFLRD